MPYGGILQPPPSRALPRWETEEVFTDGDAYFEALIEAIGAARHSVTLETYIFDWDTLGRRVADALVQASDRGVSVRLVVDSLGSLFSKIPLLRALEQTGVECRVYHQFPWERLPPAAGRAPRSILQLLANANRRNHRKVCVLDTETAFVGGMNISDVHLASVHAHAAWVDAGVRLQGPGVMALAAAFERIWPTRMVRDLWARRGPGAQRRSLNHPLVRLNYSRRLRSRAYQDLLAGLRTARKRIWITTAYFVPTQVLRSELRLAAARGVDVRILLPQRSDVFFMPWATRALAARLLSAGVHVFEYLPSFLHAKVVIVDDVVTLGSSNLNSRSLIHDLEVDVILTSEAAREAVVQGFLVSLSSSREIHAHEEPLPWWKRLVGRVLLTFRHWM